MTDDQHSKAKFYLQSKRYNDGLRYVKTLLADSPHDDTLYAFLSLFYQGLMNLKEAENAVKMAIQLNPAEYLHFKNVAKIHILSQNAEKAKKFISTALSLNPHDADLFGFKGIVYILKQEPEKAIQIANEGLGINPINSQCRRAKALALSILQEREGAEEIIKDLLRDDPVNAQNLFIKGLVSLSSSKNTAKKELESSLAFQPNNPHIQGAYRVSLRSELPGFSFFKNWAIGLGKSDSITSQLLVVLDILFFLFCFFTLSFEDIDTAWVGIYLAFWNLNLVIHLSLFVFLPFYDSWLFLMNKNSMSLFTKELKIKTVTLMCFIFISLIVFILAIISRSPELYLFALHISTFIVLVYQIMHPVKPYRWWAIYLVIVILCLVLSIYYFNKYVYLFIAFNVVFRILSIAYHKLMLQVEKLPLLKAVIN